MGKDKDTKVAKKAGSQEEAADLKSNKQTRSGGATPKTDAEDGAAVKKVKSKKQESQNTTAAEGTTKSQKSTGAKSAKSPTRS